MSTYIALLRAINVGGTGRLPMSVLKSMCEDAGFESVKTYIASGNVIFKSTKNKNTIKKSLESKLKDYAGKPVGVFIKSTAELKSIIKNNPFPEAAPNKSTVLFLDRKATASDIRDCSGVKNEHVSIGSNELYVHYPEGMSATKLSIPAAKIGTARNMNTINKLMALASEI